MKNRSFNSEFISLTIIDSSLSVPASSSQKFQYTQESSKTPDRKPTKEEFSISILEETSQFSQVKQIDKPIFHKIEEGELRKEEEREEGRRVKFIWREEVEEGRKREAFDPTKKAKKSILKRREKENLDGRKREEEGKKEEEKKKVDLAQIIEASKKTYAEEFLKEEKKVMNSAQFLKIWIEIKKDKETAWSFLKVNHNIF